MVKVTDPEIWSEEEVRNFCESFQPTPSFVDNATHMCNK